MKPLLTAVICTHNPRQDYLEATLDSLRTQSPLQGGKPWELIVLDNASTPPLEGRIDLSWHNLARVVREERLGLTHARLRSFREAGADILVYIDDDNVLAPNYLSEAFLVMASDVSLGAAGGKSLPVYESEPAPWFHALGIDLACRDLGEEAIYVRWEQRDEASRTYPECAPIGAGMVVRKDAYRYYVEQLTSDGVRQSLGRKGTDLSSGEDNDMVMSVLAAGYRVAYWPQLTLNHLIPARRLSREYLAKYAYSSNRTWVQVLALHGSCPWPPIPAWTAPLRKARAYFRLQAWRGPANHVRWKGACGHFEGLASLPSQTKSMQSVLR